MFNKLSPIFMKITRVITKMAAGSNSSVWQNLLLLSRQNEFSDLPAECTANLKNLIEKTVKIWQLYRHKNESLLIISFCWHLPHYGLHCLIDHRSFREKRVK